MFIKFRLFSFINGIARAVPHRQYHTGSTAQGLSLQMEIIRHSILIKGIVQGVGFRPFVVRLAKVAGITGLVTNTSSGVEIEAQGRRESVELFMAGLRDRLPPMALVLETVVSDITPVEGETSFAIRPSRTEANATVVVPPDIATCPNCLNELLDPGNRRHHYPFINCTDCGPRYSIIESIPYDRPGTGMKSFTLCIECKREYEDINDRRFHAQPNACPRCGPVLEALNPGGDSLDGDPLELAREYLAAGKIVALMGLGGFHLACDAMDEGAVSTLRQRKQRPKKPFAVMASDIENAGKIIELDATTRALLTSPSAPIVISQSSGELTLAGCVAPGQTTLGVFLPYTPLHHLLFTDNGGNGPKFLVMTSGNRSDEPIISTTQAALEKLGTVADLFIVHNRPIVHPVDDSVVKSVAGVGDVMVRRARGYAPRPLPLPLPASASAKSRVVLALGAELVNTICIASDGLAYLGPHVGDLKNLETEEGYRRSIDHLLELLEVQPDLVACDLHPDYRSSAIAREWEKRGIEVVRVQHHEAHATACMAEHGFSGEALAMTLDGIGLGHDKTAWGGELLAGSPGHFTRVAHLAPVHQPGGDRAAREPWRMAAAYLRKILGSSWNSLPLQTFSHQTEAELETLETMMERDLGSPLTSSCGRLFDGAAAILGFTGPMLYSAQAPIELEGLASTATATREYPPALIEKRAGTFVIDPSPILSALLDDSLEGTDRGSAALGFHSAVAKSFAAAALMAASDTGLKKIFLTGGCFQNGILLREMIELLEKLGLEVYCHRQVPPNDGGISFGQAAYALLHKS